MARSRRKRAGKTPKKKTLVRGADGALYLLSENKAPKKLAENEAQKLTKILEDAENDLSNTVKNDIPSLGASCVRLLIPEVFME